MTHSTADHRATARTDLEDTSQPGHAVLVVDDDNGIRELLKLVLQGAGYDVLTAIDGLEALRLLHDPDDVGLILLDMRMPRMDGWSFARAYHAKYRNPLPIIVITAAQDAQSWAAQIQAQGHLAKPFSLGNVRNAVQRFLAPTTEAS